MKRTCLMLVFGGLVSSLLGCGGGASVPATVSLRTGGAASEQPGGSGTSGGGPVQVEGFGTFRGRIVLSGSAITLPNLVEKGANVSDKAICSADAIPDESLLVDSATNGIANVFIYMPKAPIKPPALSTEPLIFDQKNCRFLPHALIAQTGQPVRVLSGDAVLHNTHTFPTRNDGFNQSISPNDREGRTLTYTRSERQPFQVKCDIHAWMQAWHLPLDHPWGTVTSTDGTFEIPDVPAGKQTFVIWHERAGYIERKYAVEIPVDGVAEKEISVAGSDFTVFKGRRPTTVIVSSR